MITRVPRPAPFWYPVIAMGLIFILSVFVFGKGVPGLIRLIALTGAALLFLRAFGLVVRFGSSDHTADRVEPPLRAEITHTPSGPNDWYRMTLPRMRPVAQQRVFSVVGTAGVVLVVINLLLLPISPALIIGLPITGLMALGALTFVAIGRSAPIVCPYCSKASAILSGRDEYRCPRCHNLTIITWKP